MRLPTGMMNNRWVMGCSVYPDFDRMNCYGMVDCSVYPGVGNYCNQEPMNFRVSVGVGSRERHRLQKLLLRILGRNYPQNPLCNSDISFSIPPLFINWKSRNIVWFNV